MATLKHKRFPPQLSHAHTRNTVAFSLDGCLCGSMVLMNTLLLTDDSPELFSMGRQQNTRKNWRCTRFTCKPWRSLTSAVYRHIIVCSWPTWHRSRRFPTRWSQVLVPVPKHGDRISESDPSVGAQKSSITLYPAEPLTNIILTWEGGRILSIKMYAPLSDVFLISSIFTRTSLP